MTKRQLRSGKSITALIQPLRRSLKVALKGYYTIVVYLTGSPLKGTIGFYNRVPLQGTFKGTLNPLKGILKGTLNPFKGTLKGTLSPLKEPFQEFFEEP